MSKEEFQLDLDAFAPSQKVFTFKGRSYKLRLFQDMPYSDVLEMLKLEEALSTAAKLLEIMPLVQQQTKLVCPELSWEDLALMSRRQMYKLGAISMEMSERPEAPSNPQTASGSNGSAQSESNSDLASVATSPVSLASTV